MKIDINIPISVKYILNTLNENGHEAYVVGGCVRDAILNRIPNDWDICTSAKPNVVKRLFDKTIDTGIQHGTVTVMLESEPFEVTTYRIDGEYKDNRRPETVEFTNDLKKDLGRRDFTINAMACDINGNLIDYFGGIDDIKEERIACVGNPYNRFNEDALRIMRAVRFAAQLGFNIETTTYLAIESYVENLADISKERIQIELNKILLSDGIDYISTLVECGISKYCIPELDDMYGFNQHNPWHCYDVLTHSIKATNAIEPNVHLRLTMLLHDCGKPLSFELVDGRGRFYNHNIDSENIALMRMRELKYDNYTIGVVCRLIRYHDYRVEPKRSAVRKFLNKIGEEYFEMWCRVRVADIVSQNLKYSYDRLDKICKIKALYKEIQNDESAFRVKDLKISGRDIIDNNIATEGVEVGKILNKLLEAVMEEWVENEREQLLISAKLISKSV